MNLYLIMPADREPIPLAVADYENAIKEMPELKEDIGEGGAFTDFLGVLQLFQNAKIKKVVVIGKDLSDADAVREIVAVLNHCGYEAKNGFELAQQGEDIGDT